jgi:Tol biopolymer transport system component
MTERISVSSAGVQGNGGSFVGGLSADGRFVAFVSEATNLAAGDNNGEQDIYVRDRVAGTTSRVSVATDGTQANSFSFSPAVSAYGRFVAYQSNASNLVPGDTNAAACPETCTDVFVRDRQARTTERASLGPGGAEADGSSERPAISRDGRFVAFTSGAPNLVTGDTNFGPEIFVRDRELGLTERVSVGTGGVEANGQSFGAAISLGGRFVAFTSQATNLVRGDTNGVNDAFLRDRLASTTRRVSVSSTGVQGNGISAASAVASDGRFVAFGSLATNLVPGDTNGVSDVFVRRLAP